MMKYPFRQIMSIFNGDTILIKMVMTSSIMSLTPNMILWPVLKSGIGTKIIRVYKKPITLHGYIKITQKHIENQKQK